MVFCDILFSGSHQLILGFQIFFQITMPKWHKIYPNFIWHVPPELYGLSFNSAILTKVYWNYAAHFVRVCASFKSMNPELPFTMKSYLKDKYGSKAMASLYVLLCYHSFTCSGPLLDKLFSYLPTRFQSHISDYFVYEHSSDDESVHSTNSSVSGFSSDDATYFY